jgi:hypothetical protein
LEQSGDYGCLKDTKQSRLGVQIRDFRLVWVQSRPENALPLGVLRFQCVQGGQQFVELGLATGSQGPIPYIFFGWRLPGSLQLGYFRLRPRQRFRELYTGQAGLSA